MPDRRQTLEHKLEENQKRLSLALRAGGMAAWEWTGTDDVWTDELYDLVGLPRDTKASSELFFSRVHPDDLAALQASWQRAVDGRASYESEFRVLLPQGRVRWLKGVGDVVRNERGEVVRIYGLNWDITREKELEAERERLYLRAQQASVAKGEFLAMMSHEIRTPLAAILGYTSLLEQLEHDDTKRDHLRRIARNGHFLLEIVNDVLDMSKIEAGKLEIEPRRVRIRELLRDVESTLASQAAEKGLGVSLEVDAAVPESLLADDKRLRQILTNLVGNAVKFTERGSVRIVAGYRAAGRELVVDVVDTGIGIARERLEELFEPFCQGDRSIGRRYEGTGLGLTIARRLAVLMGGDLSVDSELGQGSTFTCVVSAAAVPAERHDPSGEREPEEAPTPLSGTALVAEDRRDLADWIEHELRRAGLDVVVAHTGDEALAAARSGPAFDIAILDLWMPGVDGFEVSARLRQCGFRGPVFALTADVLEETRSRAIAQGFDRFLRKPIESRELIDAIRSALHGMRADGQARVLLVDDAVDNAGFLQTLLGSHGCRVRVASTAEAAMLDAPRFRPTIVISDLSLSDMDGLALVARLRALPELADTRFAALSGRDDVDASIRAGFDAHFTKPVVVSELLAWLAAAGVVLRPPDRR